MPIKAEDGGDRANREHFKKQSGEKENDGANKRKDSAELCRPMFVSEDASEGDER